MKLQELKFRYSDRICKLFLYFITVIFGLCMALRLNVPPVVDEVGTIANTAFLMGYDWSETLFCMGGCYFKGGYALLYYPLMLIFKNSYVLYKALLTLNVILFGFVPVFAYTIFKKHINTGRKEAFLLALSAGLFPSSVLYMMYAKADAILIILPWPIILILLELIQTANGSFAGAEKKKNRNRRIGLSVLLAFLSVFAYAAHTRGIVILLAVAVSVVLIRIICKSRTVEYISFIASAVVFLIADKLISDYFYNALFSVYGTRYSNTESYDFGYLKHIFTRDGFLSMVKLFLGTAYNVLVSTYGLAAVAVIGGIILVILYFRNKSEATVAEMVMTVFTVVCFAGTFAMSCIYFFPYVHPYFMGGECHRSDWLVYGRYIACASGPAVLLGAYILFRKSSYKGILTKVLSAGFCAAVFIGFTIKCLPYMEGISTVTRNYIQLCTFLNLKSYGITTAVPEQPGEALIKAGILGMSIFVLLLAVSFVKSKKQFLRPALIAALIIVPSITITIINYNKIRISRDEVLTEWTAGPSDLLEEVRSLAGEYPILVDSSAKSIKHYQFLCKEFTCGNITTAVADKDNFFVIAKKKYFIKDYYDDDFYTFDCYDYDNAVKDIVYVKGKELAQKLADMGYKLTKYKGKMKKAPEANNDI